MKTGSMLGAILAAALFSIMAQASEMRIVAQLPQAPGDLAMDSKGNLYATTASQELYRVHEDGTFDLVATIPSKEEMGQGKALGIAFDNDGKIIVAYAQHSEFEELPNNGACADVRVTRSGIYRVDPATGAVEAIATRGDGHPFCFPDDVDVDSAGNIYMSDLTYAGIWKISKDGAVTLWSADKLLNYSDPRIPMGVNVLVLDNEKKNIYGATTTVEGRIIRIPIKQDGTAGKAVEHSLGHSYFDGIDIDSDGYIYAAESGINQIVVIAPQAGPLGITQRRVAGVGGPLQGPTSIVVRDGIIYTANLAFGVEAEDKNRAIVAITGYEKP